MLMIKTLLFKMIAFGQV